MKKSIKAIVVEGADGLGKSTQLNRIKMKLESQGVNTHSTRLLGGDKTCNFQLALREVLLHDKFPKDSIELEEQLFAMTDLEGIKIARKYLEENEGIVLKDRGVLSHICYAMAKGMTLAQVAEVHKNVIKEEELLNQDFGVLNIVMVPDNVAWPLERIKKRALETGESIVERLENLDTQEQVANFLRMAPGFDILRNLSFEIIEVSEDDSILEVEEKIQNVLKKYDISVINPVVKEA